MIIPVFFFLQREIVDQLNGAFENFKPDPACQIGKSKTKLQEQDKIQGIPAQSV